MDLVPYATRVATDPTVWFEATPFARMEGLIDHETMRDFIAQAGMWLYLLHLAQEPFSQHAGPKVHVPLFTWIQWTINDIKFLYYIYMFYYQHISFSKYTIHIYGRCLLFYYHLLCYTNCSNNNKLRSQIIH